MQQALFQYPPAVAEQHLVLIYGRDALVFRNLSDAGTSIGPALDEPRWIRDSRLRRLRQIFGGPIRLLPRDEAMRLIDEVITVLQGKAIAPRMTGACPVGC